MENIEEVAQLRNMLDFSKVRVGTCTHMYFIGHYSHWLLLAVVIGKRVNASVCVFKDGSCRSATVGQKRSPSKGTQWLVNAEENFGQTQGAHLLLSAQ